MKTILSTIAVLVTGVAIGAAGLHISQAHAPEEAPAALVQAVTEVDGTPPPMSQLCERMQELRDLKLSDAAIDKEYARSCQAPAPKVDLAKIALQKLCTDQRRLYRSGDPVGAPIYEMLVQQGQCQ